MAACAERPQSAENKAFMTAIAIFVKTPGYSPVKTRLARAVGQQSAEQFHEVSARIVSDVSIASGIGPVYRAVAEPEAISEPCWSDLPVLLQRGGDLGRRMCRVHTELVERHGAGILLGADAPQIESRHLERASHWLDSDAPRLVEGPASDGGFWLFGANRIIPAKRWEQVLYSQSDTLEQFRQSMADCGEWLTLPTLSDLDTPEDLSAVTTELGLVPNPLPDQQSLANQLQRLNQTRMNTEKRTEKPDGPGRRRHARPP